MSASSAAPAAPDYTADANASIYATNVDANIAANQMAFAAQEYANIWPATQQYMNSMITNTDSQTQIANTQATNAQQDRDFYESTYKPIETQFASQAMNYNSPDRANQEAGAAEADQVSAMNTSRATALSNLESYGIDPSQTRYGALDLSSQISTAAAAATAGTQSRVQTYNQGLALEGQAINVGRGYSSAVTSEYGGSTGSYAGAASSGAAGINAANGTVGTYNGSVGVAQTSMGQSVSAINTDINAKNTGFSNQMQVAQYNEQQSQDMMKGIGSLIGGVASVAAL